MNDDGHDNQPPYIDPDDGYPPIQLPPGSIRINLGPDCAFYLILQDNSPLCGGGYCVGIIKCGPTGANASFEVICIPKHLTEGHIGDPPTSTPQQATMLTHEQMRTALAKLR